MRMKTTKIILLAILMSIGISSTAQVAINNDGSSPDASAILDVKSTTGGLLIPRMTTSEIQSISIPADGLQVYNADSGKLYIFVATVFEWKEVSYGSGAFSPFANITIGSGGSCNNSIVMGTYTQGEYLTFSEYVTIEVDVLSSGSYSITTDTINGYSFSTNGTFSNTGINYVNLAGSGLPNSVQTDIFTLTGSNNGGTCIFSVIVGSGGGPACGEPFTDSRDGKSYQTVQIGTQCWMAENLNIGIKINGVDNQTDNSIIEKYCYDDNTSNCDIYGGLYLWNEVMQYTSSGNGIQGICPSGWHLPTDDEWKQLEMELGMSQSQADAQDLRGTDEGGKLKETGITHWFSPNTGATNSSGFTALPGGIRYNSGLFNNTISQYGYFWSSNENSNNEAWGRNLSFVHQLVGRYDCYKASGFSVRCIKD